MKSLRMLAAGLFRRSRMERDMAEELAAHMEHRTDDLVRSGCSPMEAARRARVDSPGSMSCAATCGSRYEACAVVPATLWRQCFRSPSASAPICAPSFP